ncbi:hypothetical protein FRB90_006131 [Tulasnella sp. 427]|nr:hypothetical protein FRB90_006131 [Tulasnella sp. 427]
MSVSVSAHSTAAPPRSEGPTRAQNSKHHTPSGTSIHHLPVEILQAIFIEVVSNPEKGSTPHLAQDIVSSVHPHWADIIRKTPEISRHFWIRPSPISPFTPVKGWLSLEEAKFLIDDALSGPYAHKPISILVDLSAAECSPNRSLNAAWQDVRWRASQLLCNQSFMPLWKSVQVWDPLPTLFARDFLVLASTGRPSPHLETLSIGFPPDRVITRVDDAILSSARVRPPIQDHDLAVLPFPNAFPSPLQTLRIPSIRQTPFPNSSIYTNLISLHILDNLCDVQMCDNTPTFILTSILSLCPNLVDLGLRCTHPPRSIHTCAATERRLAELGIPAARSLDSLPLLMPRRNVTVHEGIRTLLMHDTAFRCHVTESIYFPCVERVTIKGWPKGDRWAPYLPFPPPGSKNAPILNLTI